jgi:hypothetical protein
MTGQAILDSQITVVAGSNRKHGQPARRYGLGVNYQVVQYHQIKRRILYDSIS